MMVSYLENKSANYITIEKFKCQIYFLSLLRKPLILERVKKKITVCHRLAVCNFRMKLDTNSKNGSWRPVWSLWKVTLTIFMRKNVEFFYNNLQIDPVYLFTFKNSISLIFVWVTILEGLERKAFKRRKYVRQFFMSTFLCKGFAKWRIFWGNSSVKKNA